MLEVALYLLGGLMFALTWVYVWPVATKLARGQSPLFLYSEGRLAGVRWAGKRSDRCDWCLSTEGVTSLRPYSKSDLDACPAHRAQFIALHAKVNSKGRTL